jgi:hypothetical protein
VSTLGVRAVEALSNTAFYLCSVASTINHHTPGLFPVLAELGFFFVSTTNDVATRIKADPASYDDALSPVIYNLRVGVDRAGAKNAAKPFYMYRYFNPLPGRTRYLVAGGEHKHGAETAGADEPAENRIRGVSPAKLGAWRSIFA